MLITNGYLFVYGTLLAKDNQYAAYLRQHCKLAGAGKFKGRLYDIGEYPGAVIDLNGDQYVYGSIYLMDRAEEVLKVIDAYEGLGINDPQPYEYIRDLVDIEIDNRIVACCVYIYNWPVSGKELISGGDYLRYTKYQ